MLYLLLPFAVFAAIILGVDGQCPCSPGHPQQEVCEADVVLQGVIQSERINQFEFLFQPTADPAISISEIEYRVRVRRVYKGRVSRRRNTYIFAPAGPGNCEIKFEVGEAYLITGFYRGPEANADLDRKFANSNRINVNSCQWVREWPRFSRFLRQSIRRRYLRNCDCDISECGQGNCHRATKVTWSQKSTNVCLVNSGYCRRVNGECCWNNSYRLRRCIRRQNRA